MFTRLRSPALLLLAAFTIVLSGTALRAVEAPPADAAAAEETPSEPAADAAVPAEPPADLAAGKRLWATTASCVRCHGWSGDGSPEGPGFPAGANIRELNYPPEALVDIIRCGVPSTQMPFFGRGAWYSAPCYGMTADDIGTAIPPADGSQLSDAQIETLVRYIDYQIMGHGPINLADCEAFFGVGAGQCARYQ